MTALPSWSRSAGRLVLCVAAVLASLGLVPPPPQDEGLQQELQRAIELIQEGEFAAAAGLLETITAGRDDVSSEARDLAAAYLYLGIARLYLTGEDEAREAFHEAQRRDPAFEPATAELPRRVIEVWGEARDLASVVVVTVPEGAEVAVGGLTRGHAPVSVAALPPGDYRVTISLDGYAADSRVLTLARGEDTRLEVVLAPLTPLAPPPAEAGGGGWWKWALPAGGAAAAVPLLRGGDERRPGVATPVPPSAPAAPTLTPGDGQLGVGWTAPADNGAPIDDYDVRYRTANGNWTELPDSVKSTATSTTITGLANGTEYEVQVRAGNRAGDGAWSASGTGAPVVATGDRAVLVELYNATNGPNWTDSTNWNSSAPVGEWYGVSTDGAGRVTGLHLGENQLSGPIPSSLGSLTRLEYLDLYTNQLTGSIPSSLGSLARLRQLNLADNQLTGSIPTSLGDLTRLVNLWLDGNQLSGPIPASLGRLTRLEILALYSNQLSGPIPASLGSLTRLADLALDGNQLSGPIPASLGSLTRLGHLGLGGNRLSGPIPASLGSLSRLERLGLPGNQLSGPIPASLGSLTDLQALLLEDNSLSGSIPAWLGDLTRLEYLNLRNNDLSGSIPSSLGNLTNLKDLALHDNDMSGSIPSSLGNLTNLGGLALDDNNLSGPIPPSLGRLTNLRGLWLNGNDLTGSIPPDLANLANLEDFWLTYNRLSGSIPAALCKFEDSINPQQNNVHLSGCDGSGGARSLEPPFAPAAPAPAEAPAGLRVTWTAPETGGPATTGVRPAVPPVGGDGLGGRAGGGGEDHGLAGGACAGDGLRSAGAGRERRRQRPLVGAGDGPHGRVGVADGTAERRAGLPRRRGRVHVHAGVQRGRPRPALRDAARRGVPRDRRQVARSAPPHAGRQPAVGDQGGAGLARRGDDPPAGDDGLRRGRGHLRRGRPEAVERGIGRGCRPGRDLGGRCAGGRERRGPAGLCGRPQPRGGRAVDGGLPHGGRQRAGRSRLRGGERHADLPGGRVVADGPRDGARRRARRGRGDADTDAVERVGGPAERRRGDGDDRQRRPAAAGPAGAVRADGGGARGRARRAADGGAARAGLRGTLRGPGGAAGHGARDGARPPEPARGFGGHEYARRRLRRYPLSASPAAGYALRAPCAQAARCADGRCGRVDGHGRTDGRSRGRPDGHGRGGRSDGRRGRRGRRSVRRRTGLDGTRRREAC